MWTAELKRLRTDISRVMKQVRAATPRVEVPLDVAKGAEVWEGHLDGKPVERVIIYLRSSGCFWSIRTAQDGGIQLRAGCLDCEHSVAETTFGRPVPADAYVRQFVGEYIRYDFSQYPILCIYNEGSFFNSDELPDEARREILRIIARVPEIKVVVLESLPEFLNERVLSETRDILKDKRLEIGIGLESSDPLIRGLCINKSFTLEQFEDTARLVSKYATLLAYVLVKPSFLTEREALEDAIRSVRYAFSVGAGVVSLEPLNIGEHAMSGALHRLGLYRVPWLWTILAVARETWHLGELRIGGYQFAPRYEHFAHNCDRCTMQVKEAIRRWNATYDPRYLDQLDCGCKAEWGAELRREYPPLVKRTRHAVDQLKKIYLQGTTV